MVKNSKYIDSTKKHLALIAPLDWGLGHTTRCIPVIRELQKHQIKILIACNSIQKSVLEPEFPGVTFIHLDGYGLRYGKTRFLTVAKLILQIPKILISIKQENLQLKRIIQQFNPDFVISDNRYGFYSSIVPSIIISHQLNLFTGTGNTGDRLASWFIRKLINHFDECWVPDFDSADSLAGKLSKPGSGLRLPVTYLGPLSRFVDCEPGPGERSDILAVLSGPEPQRTLFEQIVSKQLQQLAEANTNIILVRGLPTGSESTDVSKIAFQGKNIRVIDFAGTTELNNLICGAEVVISRAGYSSVMDLLKLHKRTILVPTPGQGEQEYLGAYLGHRKLAVVSRQDELNLYESLKMTDGIRMIATDMENYKKVIASKVNRLRANVVNSITANF